MSKKTAANQVKANEEDINKKKKRAEAPSPQAAHEVLPPAPAALQRVTTAPASASRSPDILALQRTVGNRAVTELYGTPGRQPRHEATRAEGVVQTKPNTPKKKLKAAIKELQSYGNDLENLRGTEGSFMKNFARVGGGNLITKWWNELGRMGTEMGQQKDQILEEVGQRDWDLEKEEKKEKERKEKKERKIEKRLVKALGADEWAGMEAEHERRKKKKEEAELKREIREEELLW